MIINHNSETVRLVSMVIDYIHMIIDYNSVKNVSIEKPVIDYILIWSIIPVFDLLKTTVV